MKKIINDPNQVVQDMVAGMVAGKSKTLRQIPETTAIVRNEAPVKQKVGLVSGGGSGHEPAHAGYIGKGMLDAAVVGEVFTSPTPDQILEAIKAVDGGEGVFLVIKNYTGDVLNFEMAAELAEAEGIQVAKVIVNDDIAVEDSSFTTGRRGIAGTVLVHKIAGAMAESGASLTEVQRVAEKVVKNIRSIGMALSPCTPPTTAEPSFELEDREMEIGIGIHGEPGIERKQLMSADDIAVELTNKLFADFDFSGDVAVMINGMGATPEMELYIVNQKVQAILAEKNIHVYQTFVGEYMTALEMAGCSVTLLQLDDELSPLLDANTDAPAFHA